MPAETIHQRQGGAQAIEPESGPTTRLAEYSVQPAFQCCACRKSCKRPRLWAAHQQHAQVVEFDDDGDDSVHQNSHADADCRHHERARHQAVLFDHAQRDDDDFCGQDKVGTDCTFDFSLLVNRRFAAVSPPSSCASCRCRNLCSSFSTPSKHK